MFTLYIMSFFFYGIVVHLDLHSFPTRRSSDLLVEESVSPTDDSLEVMVERTDSKDVEKVPLEQYVISVVASERSEEHTSELQSRGQLVCRLLLEKKNQT